MNECDVCYDLFEEDPIYLRFEVGRANKIPFIMNTCKKCASNYQKVIQLQHNGVDISSNPIKVITDQAIHLKVAISRKSII